MEDQVLQLIVGKSYTELYELKEEARNKRIGLLYEQVDFL